VHLPAGTTPTSYLKSQNGSWVDFRTGAVFAGNVLTLHLVDGGAGDGNATAGVIRDPSAPVGSPFEGFLGPVDNRSNLNVTKAGSAIPVKFRLGGDQGLAVFATGYPKSQAIPCDSDAPVDGIAETVTAGASGLSHDAASHTYTYYASPTAALTALLQPAVTGGVRAVPDAVAHPRDGSAVEEIKEELAGRSTFKNLRRS